MVVGDRLLTMSQRRTKPVFDDVPASSEAFDAINLLRQAQVTLGCSTTPALYCPEQALTRGQTAALLIRALFFPSGNFPFPCYPRQVEAGSFQLFTQTTTAGSTGVASVFSIYSETTRTLHRDWS
jgi:hypothetical protein